MKHNRIVSILLIVLITALAVHIFFNLTEGARVDLTQTKLYSLTEGTHEILDKMKEEGVKPIEIKLYFSMTTGKTLPRFIKNFITYNDYVRNLLREYERYADGKISVATIDPKPDSDEAQDAADYRLQGQPLNQQGDVFYFGLVFETQTGSRDVIEFLWPEEQETIEYEISKKIFNLLWPQKKRIAVLSSLEPLPDNNPYMAQMLAAQGRRPSEPWIIMQLLQETYSVTMLDKGAEQISKDDYDLLMVIHPKSFPDKTLWAVNEWVVTGKPALIFLDPFTILDQAPNNPQQPWAQLQYKPASNLDKLLSAWGLKRREDLFAVDYDLAVKRSADRGRPAEKFITDLMITDQTTAMTLNQDLPVTQGLSNVRFLMPGAIEKLDSAPEGVVYTPIVTTTEAGGEILIKPGFGGKDELAFTDLNEPAKLLNEYEPRDQKLTLVLMAQGKLPSAFPDGATFPKEAPEAPPGMPPGFQMPVPEDAEMIEKEAIPEDQLAESRVMVFGDLDFVADQLAFQQSLFGVRPNYDNHKLFMNAADYMVGAEELMKVRAKKNIRRPFTRFDQIEAQADKRLLEQERQIQADIDRFQEELREKQGDIGKENAALFKKKMADDIDQLNEQIRERQRSLREIRKQKRALLEREEAFVRFSIMWAMPLLVCLVGVFSYFKRSKRKDAVSE